jgi:glycosyltransferase involved in cell wall biosynthesis
MVRPMVSVRFMVYNNEEYIREAVESILLQQTDFMVEIVVGDDFSTDSTLDIIKEYKNTDKIHFNILQRVVNGDYWNDRKRSGRVCNFKNIVENCSGKYVALLDGDDYWTDPLKLQKQVDFLEVNHDYAGSFHDTTVINEQDTDDILKPFRGYKKSIFNLEDTISTIALFHTSSFVFRRDLLEIPTWFTKVQSADMALFAIIASNGPLYRIDATMSVYRKNEGGVTSTIKIKDYHKKRIELFKHLRTFCSIKVKSNIDEVIRFHKGQLKIFNQSKFKSRIKRFLKF